MNEPFVNFFRAVSKRSGAMTREHCNIHFVEGPFAEILGVRGGNYRVQCIDQATAGCVHETSLARNHWTRGHRKYFTDWRVLINDHTGRTVVDYRLNLKGSHVYIALDSKALGDSLAWMPFVEEFRVRHGCRVTCSTFWNELFDEAYPEIRFVSPGSEVQGIVAMYKVGCFNVENRDLSPAPWNSVPLQAVAADILGLPRQEIRPKLVIQGGSRPPKLPGPYVCIATESTSQCKFWNRPGGWEELTARLNAKGLQVVNLSLNANRVPGAVQWPNGPIHRVIDCLLHAEFFVGLPSGLSWLAWALSKKVVTISGFALPSTEFQSNRIQVGPPAGVCQGCYNTHVFDPGNWNWCPKKPATPFECTREITVDAVMAAI
jgi:autotransporter strand-loop-strand O-heptosyltransferase